MSRATLGMICFLLGMVMDQAMVRSIAVKPEPMIVERIVTATVTTTPIALIAPSRNPVPFPSSVTVAPSQAEPLRTSVDLVPAPTVFDPSAELATASDFETRMEFFMEAPLPDATQTARISNADGSEDIHGTTSDGRDTFQHFNSQGKLISESWSNPAGESFNRNFYENGKPRMAFWANANESYSVSYRESGYPESRMARTAEGKMKITDYDEQGNIRNVQTFDSEDVKSANLPEPVDSQKRP